MEEKFIDNLIEIYLRITKTAPNALAGRAFTQFYRLLLNKDKLKNNTAVGIRFTYKKENIQRLNLSLFFSDNKT